MSDSERDVEFIEDALGRLCDASAASSDQSHDRVREYIYFQEFQLALDLLAYFALTSEVPPSPDTCSLFENLAVRMDMKDGDMWRSVAKLRKAWAHSAP